MLESFETILDKLRNKPKKTIAVAMAEEDDVLQAVDRAYDAGIADAVLVGDRKKIHHRCEKIGIDLTRYDVVHAKTEQQSVVFAIQLVHEHLADALMKGKCGTATLLRGVLNKEHGLRGEHNTLCHLSAFESPFYHKLVFMSDAALNISPDVTTKAAILQNVIQSIHKLGLRKPRVAVIAAVEKVNFGAMPCTRDAAILSQMGERGQIPGAIIDGPLALDNAVSKNSCKVKNIKSRVAGNADILLMPDIESANVFYKAMSTLGQARTAGIIIGAKVPIILTSRADSDEAKFLSIALGIGTSQR